MISRKYLSIVGIIVFVFIILNFDLFKILRIALNIDLFYLCLFVFFSVFIFLLKAFKWTIILKAHACELKILPAFKYYLAGFFSGIFTPARLGDFSRAAYLNDTINHMPKSISSVLIDRLQDVGVLITLGLFASLALAH